MKELNQDLLFRNERPNYKKINYRINYFNQKEHKITPTLLAPQFRLNRDGFVDIRLCLLLFPHIFIGDSNVEQCVGIIGLLL